MDTDEHGYLTEGNEEAVNREWTRIHKGTRSRGAAVSARRSLAPPGWEFRLQAAGRCHNHNLSAAHLCNTHASPAKAGTPNPGEIGAN